MTYANLITIFRIIAIPFMVVIFFYDIENSRYYVILIFSVAAITDYLDGFVARKMDQVTALGRFLDPVADKLLVISSLLLILIENNNLIIFLPICIIILREVIISALREWVAKRKVGKKSGS